MKKNKKLYRNLIILGISVYFIFTIFSQQTTLSQYTEDAKELSQKIECEKENLILKLNENEKVLQMKNSEIEKIYNSKSWKYVRKLAKIFNSFEE